MRKRINTPKSDSRAGEGQKVFRRSTDSGRGATRPFAKARPEGESRFSKPSIKRSSFRPSNGADASRANTERPRFDKPDFDKPRSTGRDGDTREFKPRGDFNPRERSDRPRFDKPKFDAPRSSNRDGASREFKPRGEFNSRDRKESWEGKPAGNREFKSREGFEKPLNRADRDTREFKPREGFSRDDRKPSFDRPRPADRADGDNRREFKPREEFTPRDRFNKESGSDRPRTEGRNGESRGFKPREDRPYSDRNQRTDFKKKDSEAPEVNNVSDEGVNRRVGRFESAPKYNLAGYEKKSGIKRKAESPEMRLNRYISNAGICSRREADDLIASGQISVNGKTITEMGYKVMPTDVVKYGKKSLNPEKLVYILINKPKDYITTTEDPEDRKTVLDLIQGACFERVYPVGRLDRNTTGLLLLTNDGELAVKLTHPSGGVKKIYQAELDRPITTEDFEKLQSGLELEDGFIRPDEVGIVTADAMVVGIEIHSGRNRIVRRIFEHLGYEVQKLDRTVFAGLNKKELPRGKWRFLSEKEVVKLKYLL
jgi:23S rRNA pseudouridine2605 synthase